MDRFDKMCFQFVIIIDRKGQGRKKVEGPRYVARPYIDIGHIMMWYPRPACIAVTVYTERLRLVRYCQMDLQGAV